MQASRLVLDLTGRIILKGKTYDMIALSDLVCKTRSFKNLQQISAVHFVRNPLLAKVFSQNKAANHVDSFSAPLRCSEYWKQFDKQTESQENICCL